MLLSKLIRVKSIQKQEVPSKMIATNDHIDMLLKLTNKNKIMFKQFFHPDPCELVIKCGRYSVVKEYEESEFICYSLYEGRKLLKVVYKDEVELYLRKR